MTQAGHDMLRSFQFHAGWDGPLVSATCPVNLLHKLCIGTMWARNTLSGKISRTKGKLYEPVKLCAASSSTAS